ncbi:MAG: CHAT domain-containing protein, partial [Myxococcales bacterium]|nr:CHAT domain-containing protein [Myxococcales bacterium]
GRPDDALCAVRAARGRQLRALDRRGRLENLSPEARARFEAALGGYRRARATLDAEVAEDWGRTVVELEAHRARRAAAEQTLRARLDEAFAALAEAEAPFVCLPPAPDERLLVWFESDRGVIGFIAGGGPTVAVRLRAVAADAPPEAQGAALLDPLGDALAERLPGARRLRLLPAGGLAPLDLHALPWRGQPLIAHRPVVYGLDLPARTPTQGKTAVVIGDPTENLQGARAEAEATTKALTGGGWRVEALLGKRADAVAVRRAIAGAALLHYAGHGEAEVGDPWAARLPLAGGTALTLGDVLTEGAVPRLAVLAGCQTGLTSAEGTSGGMSFAPAFLLAGSAAVIGVTRAVTDDAAAAFSAAFYGDRSPPEADMEAAFARAALALRETHPYAWRSFRLFVR